MIPSRAPATFDARRRALVRIAAAVAAGTEAVVRSMLEEALAVGRSFDEAIEEVLLQSYLFAGFPRALNAMREWRRLSGRPAPAVDAGAALSDAPLWAVRGEATCATVYGPMYDGLRRNIKALHPALDAWMIVEGYGKVLSRPGLPLEDRELCIVAACLAAGQERQLHSHFHGALHAGATPADVGATIDAVAELADAASVASGRALWEKVRRRHDVH